MDIKNARRILCLGSNDGQALKVVRGLTGSAAATKDTDDVDGLSHFLDIKTAYYNATVPIWLDEITDIAKWQDEFTQAEAGQVIEAIGAWILCFTDDGTASCNERFEKYLQAIQAVLDAHCESTNDAVMLAVAVPSEDCSAAMTDDRYNELEDITLPYNFEIVDYSASGINDYGEQRGLKRLREALEANDWTSSTAIDEDDVDLDDLDSLDFANAGDILDLKETLVDNATSIAENDQVEGNEGAEQVDDLEAMLGKLLAVKEQSSNLPLAQRKRIAAQAVREVMQAKGP